jgi:hypothetical protein
MREPRLHRGGSRPARLLHAHDRDNDDDFDRNDADLDVHA